MNGNVEFVSPTTTRGRQCLRSAGSSPRSASTGSRHSEAPITRTADSGIGPKAGVTTRISMKDAPHRAARMAMSMASESFKSGTAMGFTP